MNEESQRLLQEWQRRQGILRSLNAWAESCGFVPAAHHRLLNKELEAVERGENKRLAIFMPPGSAKSTYSSVLFPPHYLAQQPSRAILACSHTTELAESFGRRSRNIIQEHHLDLGYELAEHSKAAGRWETTNNGQFLGAGVGVGIAGYRADLGLIDDPIRNKEQADSKLEMDKQWDWYNYDFKPRLKPHAAVVLIQTRWREDDLAGRILASAEGPDWKVIRIPFFAEENDPLDRQPGELLWPEWLKKEMFPSDPRVAQALYQNNPTPESGDFFKAEWLVEYKPEQIPKNLRYYAASDHATSERTQSDPTLIVIFGVDEGDNIWILPDFFWERANTGVVVEKMFYFAKTYRPVTWFTGKEHITSSLGPFIDKRMFETGVYFVIDAQPAKKDKVSRCGSINGRMGQKKVFFPGYHPRWHEIRHEILSFPLGTHDEWPDVLGEIGRGMGNITRSYEQKEEVKDDFTPKPFRPTMAWVKASDALAKRREVAKYGDR